MLENVAAGGPLPSRPFQTAGYDYLQLSVSGREAVIQGNPQHASVSACQGLLASKNNYGMGRIATLVPVADSQGSG